MNAPAATIAACASPGVRRIALRATALSAGGPMATSGAHFVASLIFLQRSAARRIRPVLVSADRGAVFAQHRGLAARRRPDGDAPAHTAQIDEPTLATHLKANLVFAAARGDGGRRAAVREPCKRGRRASARRLSAAR